MKLGVSYNVFDGEELLETSIKQIRELVDYITVVYQKTSNYGDTCNPELIPLLEKLVSEGLVDKIVNYTPFLNQSPHFNEVLKRNTGLILSKNFGCTHHMSMDSDEIYDTQEFANLKKIIIDNDYDSSYCQMLTYYKTWDYILDPPEEYYVSLIYKIKDNSQFIFGINSPVLIDPTRRMSNVDKPVILERKTIQLHHGSYIRNNIKKKFKNSSALVNFSTEIENLVEHFNKWEYPNQVLLAGLPCKYHNVIKINNLILNK